MNHLDKIMIDRYAIKSPIFTPEIGDFVAVKGQPRQYGFITSVDPLQVSVDDETLDVSVFQLEKVLESSWEQIASRVANYVMPENPEPFYEIIKDKKFIPGGRILAGASEGSQTSLYNCFVIPYPEDSIRGIFDSIETMAQIMRMGGGVGLNISTLRPRNAPVYGVNGSSSGAVSWAELWSTTTGLIQQGGSRRGALMLIMEIWHPDIVEFIEAKKDFSRLTNCNISVGITDDFMRAVKDGSDWELRFPDTQDKSYNLDWANTDGRLTDYTGKWVTHKTVKARWLWELICQSAWQSAEPGIWFIDRANYTSNSGRNLIATNPCAEQPLPEWGVCNLGAINLSQFSLDENGLAELYKVSRLATQFLNRVIDKTRYPFSDQESKQSYERRIGLGTMGLAEMLINAKIKYGANSECDNAIEMVYKTIALGAYSESVELVKEYGCVFDQQTLDRISDNVFRMGREFYPLAAQIREYGLVNITLTTQAPTGTTATVVGTSTGIEPYFAMSWQRNTRLGPVQEFARPALTHSITEPYMVTAQSISPMDHVHVLALVQRYTDSSVSKTCNIPYSWTVEDVQKLYMHMYDLGCKGGTIYRDGSRDIQVLIAVDEEPCPECGSHNIEESDGCTTCKDCGFSKCSI